MRRAAYFMTFCNGAADNAPTAASRTHLPLTFIKLTATEIKALVKSQKGQRPLRNNNQQHQPRRIRDTFVVKSNEIYNDNSSNKAHQ